MSKLCMIKREEKRRKVVEKFKAKRLALNETINNVGASSEERADARAQLQNLPRNSSPVRLRNRCALTGRPRGVYKKFGLARGKLRDLMMAGEVPGVVKASW